MSHSHSATKGQLFASPGVVIRKSVVLKPSRYVSDGFAKGLTANSHLPSVKDTTCQQSVTEPVCQPVICSSEGRAPSPDGLDENGNPVEVMMSVAADVPLPSVTESRTSVESVPVVPAQSSGRQTVNDRRRSSKHASSFALSRRKTKTTEMSSAGTSGIDQGSSHFELTSAQIFLYDAYKEVLQLKSHGLAKVYCAQL